ncbi:3-deoxy-D-manno-octulosonic-acid transferase [Desulfurella amilsii]|uniref:3-deoxy-D-manno-octulosonic acid transferase n=1 Tax=Desulfurella amilsii TaxID=1562698 RepID=A0A1X4XVM6_9BACT|nr:glycosyltransferase N-terminal domain-containing protein [Desulfurella amilsii]OSS41589.1 3-deoxy-D-manno-octulosonic-acid transferase [Desulfurella amilsii]
MLSYNIILLLVFIIISPFLLYKAITKKRFRYRLFDRVIPKAVQEKDYILVHLASLGEAKAFLNIKDTIENLFKKKIIFSVTSNIGYDYLKKEGFDVFLAPLDFYFLYKKLFNDNLPFLSIFFETEIWPAYINFFKNNHIRIFLINARMSEKSYKFYKKLKVFFSSISKFDVIIAKSQNDKERFYKFNKNVKVCDNVKYALQSKKFEYEFLPILKSHNKKIFVFSSFHCQELDFLSKAIIRVLSFGYKVVLAPRYLEDLPLFEKMLKDLGLDYNLLSSMKNTIKDCILVDSFGVLEAIYSISDKVFVGGSVAGTLKGHNPIEPAIYKNFVFCGLYMDSFKEEVGFLKKLGCLAQINDIDELSNYLKQPNLAFCDLEQKRQQIIECYKRVFLKFVTQA